MDSRKLCVYSGSNCFALLDSLAPIFFTNFSAVVQFSHSIWLFSGASVFHGILRKEIWMLVKGQLRHTHTEYVPVPYCE